jgi:hypothetical protein
LQTDDARRNSSTYVAESWRRMVESVSRFLAHLGPRDRVAIAVFEDKVETLMDWRYARSGQVQEVRMNPQESRGPKDLYGAIEWATRKLQGESGRKAVIIFTDGRDGRLAPQWFRMRIEEVFDPFFGLVVWEKLKVVRQRIWSVRAGFALFSGGEHAALFWFQGQPVSGLFPGMKRAYPTTWLASGLIEFPTRPTAASCTAQARGCGSSLRALYQDLHLGAHTRWL